MENVFYVYVYLDPRKPGDYIYGEIVFDHEPFYIGKGKNKRINEHRRRVYNSPKEVCNPFKINKIKSILRKGFEPIQIIHQDNLSEVDAFTIEVDIIRKIGRVDKHTGPLCNLTDGGEGASGLVHKQESKDKLSKTLKEKYANNEMTTWNKGMKGCHSNESIAKIRENVSKATKGKKKNYSPESKAALKKRVSEQMRNRTLSEIHIKNMKKSWEKRREKMKIDKELGINKPRKSSGKGRIPWNKGLTKDDSRVAKQGWKEEDKDRMREMVSSTHKNRKHTEEHIRNYVNSRTSKVII